MDDYKRSELKRNFKRILYAIALVVIITAMVLWFTDTINAAMEERETITETSAPPITTTTEIPTAAETTTETTTTTTTETTTKPTTTTTTERKTTTTEVQTTTEKSDDALYSASYFRRMGEIYWNGWRWTWYSEKVLPGNGLHISGRHLDDSKYVCDEDGYICLASSVLKHGTVIDTPFGKQGNTIDVYVGW